jgi:hypothetical protein
MKEIIHFLSVVIISTIFGTLGFSLSGFVKDKYDMKKILQYLCVILLLLIVSFSFLAVIYIINLVFSTAIY